MVGGVKISTPGGGLKINNELARFVLISIRENVIRVRLPKRS